MRSRTARLVALAAASMLFAAACDLPVQLIGRDADTGERIGYYSYDLLPVPHDPAADGGSDVRGAVSLVQRGNEVTVRVLVAGTAPGLPHAQHLHGSLSGPNSCPTLAQDANADGLISTAEGVPTYGAVKVSLTTEGDSSADSALAVDRFPVATDAGVVAYTRTVTVSDELAANLDRLHVVIHGIDVNRNGSYDFGAGPSSLDPSLPLEATVPAACGGFNG